MDINHTTSFLISTLVNIIFAIFKNDVGILDYNKMQSNLKYIVYLPQGTVGWSSACDCDISWSYSLFANIIFPSMIKYFYWQKRSQ